ncbi:hypothetical protein QBC37DRAFT_416540 [Rhypophila decipiens]|uniref:Uncharacterized protein n=1 Tax=Rhypophila decipiens TaxID=261697 RepID=A0AAN7BD40_9PEZI|nr:hypothetical protein QBC37DRAFT_416540 [Rhypophila decipiens]
MKTKTILHLGLASLLISLGVTAAVLQSNIRDPLPLEVIPGNAKATLGLVPTSEQLFNISSLVIKQNNTENRFLLTTVYLNGNIPPSQLQKLQFQTLNRYGNPMEKAVLTITGGTFERIHQEDDPSITLSYPFRAINIANQGFPIVNLEFLDHMGRPLPYLHLGTGKQSIRAQFLVPMSYLEPEEYFFEVSARMWDEEKDEPGIYLFGFGLLHTFIDWPWEVKKAASPIGGRW